MAQSACLLVGFVFLAPFSALANTSDDLGKLEMKFFQHTYPKDTQTQRIERIEKTVYGEPGTGSEQARLSKLVSTIPADESVASSPDSTPAATPEPSAPDKPSKTAAKPAARPQPAERPNVSGTKYPAVTAIEQKILHQSFEQEPVDNRLARLETKMFGKPSSSTDLGERVDRLKQTSGIDVAARPPGGSDWSDEDDPLTSSVPTSRNSGGGNMGGVGNMGSHSGAGEDGMSFSGRNLRQDMNKAFGNRGAAPGSFGMGSSSTGGSWGSSSQSSSGAYGFGGGTTRGAQPPRQEMQPPRQVASNIPTAAPRTLQTTGMGLSQQVAALESEVFGKPYPKEGLPVRLSRLEANVFPSDKAAGERPLPERVSKLVAAVPISAKPAPGALAQRSKDKDFDFGDDDDLNIPSAPQRKSLGNIMNQLGNMMNNTNFVGGYSMPAGTLGTDPSTGLMIDRTNGNLIDPTTGMVVGRRVAPSPYAPPPVYGAPPYGAPVYGAGGGMVMPPFNNGFSQFGGGSVNYGSRPLGTGQRGLGMWP